MDAKPTDNAHERELVQRFLARLPQPQDEPCLDEFELASYIDGLADAAEAERIESHLALCSRCRRTLLDVRTLSDEPVPPVDRLVERARRLVGPRSPSRWRRVAGRVAAAAAVVVFGLAGLQAGLASQRVRLRTDEALLAEVTFRSGEPAPYGDVLDGLVEQGEEDVR